MRSMSGTLTIDLTAIQKNYLLIDEKTDEACKTGASVKAGAYGLGADRVLPALHEAGARRFFVATIEEGIEARRLMQDADIYILNGFWLSEGQSYIAFNLIPVLNSLAEVYAYKAFVTQYGEKLPAAIHFDTGMNRLGIREDEAALLIDDLSVIEGIDVRYIMSHFTSADERGAVQNKEQYQAFSKLMPHFPDVGFSLSNSGSVFQKDLYHFDLVRTGIALYGGTPIMNEPNPMNAVVSLTAPILQIHTAKKGDGAGYNAAYIFEEDTNVAVISIGYADGFLRSLSDSGKFYYNGVALPIRGRVSMDLVICDLCHLNEADYPNIGDDVEVIGENQSIDDLAADAGTICYEILTSLGARYPRVYID